MSESRILVIDAGTSALRAVSVRANGETQLVAREPWAMSMPDDAAPFGREIPAPSACAALQRVIDAAAPASYGGIAITGQREGLVFADEAGHAVLVSPNVDARASAEGMAIDAAHANAVYGATGHLPSLLQVPAKLAWLNEHRAADAGRVRWALPLADWLAATLTGKIAGSRSLLVENGMLDVAAGGVPAFWSTIGMSPDVPPAVVADGAIAGTIPGSSTPVALCGGDTQCALVGVGAIRPGDGAVAAGWSAPVQVVTGDAVFDPAMRTWTSVHVVQARWIVESNAGETGRAWDWLLSMLGISPEEADAAAATSPVGARDVMAIFGPSRMNAAAMNAGVGGITVPLPIVMSSPSRADLLRAALEATAFAIRANLEQAEAVANVRVRELGLGGGMSRSVLLSQILADVLDRPVRVATTPETSALGAAVLASSALSVHDSLAAAVKSMVLPSRVVEPDAKRGAAYEDAYQRWFAMSDAFEAMP